MEMYEVRAILKYSYYANRDSWEQTRFLGYLTAQANTKKKLKIQDIMQFDWDNDSTPVEDKSISNADIQRLREKAKEYSKLL